jgi:hypothetical protein
MGLLDIFNDPYQPSASIGTAGLLSPEDKLMALFSGLSGAGMAMAQPGLSKGQALAMGLGGLGQGMARGRQTALQERLFMDRLANQQRQQKAQDDYLAANPQHAALARAVGPEAFKTLLDRSIPKKAETPFGYDTRPDGSVVPTPGAFDSMAQLEAMKTGGRTMAERNAQNDVPLLTDQPEFKARVAGAETAAREQAGLPYVGPKAAATEAATLPYAGPRAAAVAQAQQAAQSGTQSFTREGALRDDFTKLTTDFRTVQDAYNKIGEAAKTPTGAGDMSLLYSYVKLLDPGSVVRESEFATAAASGSLGERMQGYVNRVLSGERLPDTLRKDFLDQARGIYTAQKKGYDNLTTQYETLAKNYGVDPKNVTTRFDTPGGPPATPELPTTGYTEGTILTGPKGEQKIMRGGKWVDLK